MYRTQYSHLTNEEFYRLLVSQPVLSPLETEAMIRLGAVMDEGDAWDGSEKDSDIDEIIERHNCTVGGDD